MSSSADGDDGDSRSAIISQETGATYEILELELEEKERDVTKRIPSARNVPMAWGLLGSYSVGTSTFVVPIRSLQDDMDLQAMKTSVVEITSIPTETTKSAEIQTLYKTVCEFPDE